MKQRSASTSTQSTEPRSPWGVAAATALAVGSVAWYYHLYGRDVHAMTPAEEGYVLIATTCGDVNCCISAATLGYAS